MISTSTSRSTKAIRDPGFRVHLPARMPIKNEKDFIRFMYNRIPTLYPRPVVHDLGQQLDGRTDARAT
jgi:hypothetical protein